MASRLNFPALLGGERTLRATIESHDNNYALVRLILSASVIYFHSFGMATGYVDHLTMAFLPVASVGGLAVQMFFFLSGLFVAQSFHKDPHIPSFILKRFLRIWPGLFVCLFVTAAVIGMISGVDPLSFLTFDGFYSYVLRNSVFDLTWNIDGFLDGNVFHALNGSIHTLPMEAKMYVVLAVIGALDMVRTTKRIALAGMVAFALALIPGVVEYLPFNLFNADYSRVAAALFLSGVAVYGLSPWLRPALWQGAILIPAAVATNGLAHEVLFYAAAVWIMLMVGQSNVIGRLWRPKQDLSYGIYVYGWPSQQMVMALTPVHLTPYALSAIAVTVASGFAALSWRYVEKPAIRFGKAFADRPALSVLKQYRNVLGALVALTAVCAFGWWASLRWDFAPVVPMQAHIVDFGPHDSRAGAPINQQPNGDSALWVKLDGTPPDGTIVVMGGQRLDSQTSPGTATAKVDPAILSTPGEKSIYLERRFPDRIERSNVVEMKISP